MQLIWEKTIEEYPTAMGTECQFFNDEEDIILPCRVTNPGQSLLYIYRLNKVTGESKASSLVLRKGNIDTNRWSYKEVQGKTYLDVGNMVIDFLVKNPKEIMIESNSTDYTFPDKREYHWGNKTIRSLQHNDKESHEIECVMNGKQVWKVRHRGYLYTDILKKNALMFFGTDGHGGGFYCVEIDTGKVVCDINTGGTAFYDWFQDDVILFIKDKLSRVNPVSGEIKSEYKIGRKFPYHTIIKTADNFVFTVVFTEDNEGKIIALRI